MINISDEEKMKWRSSSIRKDVVISIPNLNMTLTNDDLILETMELKEILNEGNALTFTGCIASEFTFTMRDVIQDLRGQYIEVTIAVDNEEPLPLFVGYVTSQDNLNQLDRQTNVTAYDSMTKIFDADVTSWYNGLTFPITVKNFRDSFFAQVGVIQSSATLINDTLNITSKTLKDAVINGETIVKSICQMNAVFGQIGRDGKFKYVELKEIVEGTYPAEDLYPGLDVFPAYENASSIITKNLYRSIDYEPFITDAITKVSVRDQEGLEQGAYGTSTDNQFVIADNPLVWAVDMQTVAENVYEKIHVIQFMPTKVELIGYPYLECGDVIAIHTNLNTVRTYILKRVLKGVQALTDSYDSKVDKSLPEYKQSMSTMITANEKSILRIQADIVEMNTLIADRATINQLNAVSARVGSLEADHVSVSSLNAVDAKIDTLNAKAITTENFTSQKITAGMINAGVISASKITTGQMSVNQLDLTGLSSKVIDVNTLVASVRVSAAYLNTTGGGDIRTTGSMYCGTLVVGGTTVKWGTISGVNCLVKA